MRRAVAVPIAAVSIAAGALAGIVIGAAAPAFAATPAPLSGTADALTQSASDPGTWTTTAYLNTAALCAEPVTFALQLTPPPSPGKPVPATPASSVTANCAIQGAQAARVPQAIRAARPGIASRVKALAPGAATTGTKTTAPAVAGAAALIVVWYGVFAIRSLADTRDGSVLSGRQDASFIL